MAPNERIVHSTSPVVFATDEKNKPHMMYYTVPSQMIPHGNMNGSVLPTPQFMPQTTLNPDEPLNVLHMTPTSQNMFNMLLPSIESMGTQHNIPQTQLTYQPSSPLMSQLMPGQYAPPSQLPSMVPSSTVDTSVMVGPVNQMIQSMIPLSQPNISSQHSFPAQNITALASAVPTCLTTTVPSSQTVSQPSILDSAASMCGPYSQLQSHQLANHSVSNIAEVLKEMSQVDYKRVDPQFIQERYSINKPFVL